MANKSNNVIHLDRVAREKQEKKAMEAQRRRIQKRQSIGDPAIPANDNEDFPLLAVLRRDKLYHYIEVVMEYRRLVAISEAEALKGQDYGYDAGFFAEQESRRMKGIAEVDKAAAEGWKESKVAGGDIEYTGKVRKSRGVVYSTGNIKAAAKVGDTGDGATPRTQSLHFKMTDDLLIERIDTAPVLTHLRGALGPLIEPFEDAVLGGQTLTKIGQKDGFKVKPDVAGRAIIFRALSAVNGALEELRLHPLAFKNIYEVA